MTHTQIFVLAVLIIPLIFVFLNYLRDDKAALIMAAALGIAQLLGMGVLGPVKTPQSAVIAFQGFGSPVVITLIALFILTGCLEKHGLSRWFADKLMAAGGKSESRLIGLFAGLAALLSLFMNNLASGAFLLPSALNVSRRTKIKPSKLLIPVAYGSMLGGAATYLTTANIIVSRLLLTAIPPQEPLGILDFTPAGGFIALIGLLFITIFGKKLLPDREPLHKVNNLHDESLTLKTNQAEIHPQLLKTEEPPLSKSRALGVFQILIKTFRNHSASLNAEPDSINHAFDKSKILATCSIFFFALAAAVIGVPIELAMLSAAVFALVLGLIKPEEAILTIRWRAIFLIAGMISVSHAIIQSNLAQLIGNSIVGVIKPYGAMGLVGGAYLLSAGLTQVMGAQVSPLIIAPITISAAIEIGVNPQAIALVTAIASSIAFLSPLAHPVNLIMIEPGNYRFQDFFRSGWILTIICFAALMIAVPLFWKL